MEVLEASMEMVEASTEVMEASTEVVEASVTSMWNLEASVELLIVEASVEQLMLEDSVEVPSGSFHGSFRGTRFTSIGFCELPSVITYLHNL